MTDQLAVLGGRPAFDSAKHVGEPNIPDRARLHARLDEILDSRILTNDGPMVRDFESRLAVISGAPYAVAMSSCTAALQVLFRALELTGEIIMPSFTFIATAHAAAWAGLVPVFVDVDPDSHTIDPARIRAAVTSRTSALVGVHLWGGLCAVDALQELADDLGIPLLFDGAHALGCASNGRPIGSFGRAVCLSFHATKSVHSLEGGAVLTHDPDLAGRLRRMRNFGFRDFDEVVCLGTNAKLNEICAAVGLGGLESFSSVVDHNRRNLDRYRAGLAGLPGFSFHPKTSEDSSNHQYVILRIDPLRSPLNRDDLAETLHAENIFARRYFWPGCHRSPPFGHPNDPAHPGLPVTEDLIRSVLALPSGTGMTLAEVDRIVACIRRALEQASAIRPVLSAARTSSASASAL